MKLKNKYKNSKYASMGEFFCEITDELDKLAGLTVDEEHKWRHYVLVNDYTINERCLAIRLPGGTVGGKGQNHLGKILMNIREELSK